MTTHKATIASLNEDTRHNRFTREALETLAQTAKAMRITMDFKQDTSPGLIAGAQVEGDVLRAELLLNQHYDVSGMYAVPAIRIRKMHKENGVTVIDDAEMVQLGLTFHPTDKSLAPIEIVSD